ncbi:hypothetical protein Dda3937_04445 [Dickeya dadantii 3937]|uniref:Uncharacterized protein n=1 Tax=Dickeya dadantii (strain 3937) TaxID=198628 RepID=E0SHA2_DICD3|nr:hypothetical protein Dda3937_04445 [Dickeya dadantii 3937]
MMSKSEQISVEYRRHSVADRFAERGGAHENVRFYVGGSRNFRGQLATIPAAARRIAVLQAFIIMAICANIIFSP